MPLIPTETGAASSEPIAEAKRDSGFAPLALPLFRDRWIASTISSVGTWMQDTAGTWLMTVLTASPLLIALMQTAASLPVLLLGLLAGATADIFDRRRLLIFWQIWMLASVAVLAVLTFLGHISPWALLAFTFLLNVGSAMNNPAWQAIVPELVPRELIPDTVSLNAASNNLARALGPALGGLMVASFASVHKGAGSVFLLNALSFAGVIWVLVQWKRTPLFKSALPAERIAGSIRSGLRYVRYSPTLQSSLIRAFTFTFFVSGIWSLLAVVAKRDLRAGALGYGILNGSLGVGAVVAATIVPKIRRRFPAARIIAASAWVFELTMPPAPTASPGSTISSPVASSATRGRRCTVSHGWFALAASPISRAVNRLPAGSSRSPATKSCPMGRMCCRGIPPETSVIRSWARVTSSWITTQSAPCGMTLPVYSRIAALCGSSPFQGLPAGASPTTGSVVPVRASAARIA